jgi:hypothetical protein
VISACGKSLSHKYIGKEGSTEESPATKCSLKVLMALMTVRWHQLISDIVDGEEVLQSGRGLVVKSLELWFETFDCELLVNAVICFDPLRGRP